MFTKCQFYRGGINNVTLLMAEKPFDYMSMYYL